MAAQQSVEFLFDDPRNGWVARNAIAEEQLARLRMTIDEILTVAPFGVPQTVCEPTTRPIAPAGAGGTGKQQLPDGGTLISRNLETANSKLVSEFPALQVMQSLAQAGSRLGNCAFPGLAFHQAR